VRSITLVEEYALDQALPVMQATVKTGASSTSVLVVPLQSAPKTPLAGSQLPLKTGSERQRSNNRIQ